MARPNRNNVGPELQESGRENVPVGHVGRYCTLNETVPLILWASSLIDLHLHGYIFELEDGQTDGMPLKHTVLVKPGERTSFVFTADAPGRWAFRCHLLYHMDAGMFRTVLVA